MLIFIIRSINIVVYGRFSGDPVRGFCVVFTFIMSPASCNELSTFPHIYTAMTFFSYSI